MHTFKTACCWALVVTLLTATSLLPLPGAAHAEDAPPLPENVNPMMGFPGLCEPAEVSASGPSAVRDWIATVRAWIKAHALSPYVPALESAILEVRRQEDWSGGLAADFERVAGMYPATAPYGAVAWLRAARERLHAASHADRATWSHRGPPPEPVGSKKPTAANAAPPPPARSPAQTHAERGLKDLEKARHLASLPRPVDASPRAVHHWGTLQEEMVGARFMEGQLLEAAGHFGEAATAYREVAESPEQAAKALRPVADLWQAVAKNQRRAGQKTASQASIRRALDLVEDPQRRVWFSMWQLYNDHDFLTARGEVGGVAGWPGEAFMDDARVMMRGLDGNPFLGNSLLSLGSAAFLNRENEAAVEFYLRALHDPAFMDEIAKDPSLAKALLVSFDALLQLGRFDDAEEMLDILSRLGSLDRKFEDANRAQLEEMREAKARADQAPPPTKERSEPPTQKQPARPDHLGTLGQAQPDVDGVSADPAASGDADAPRDGGTLWPWAALVILPFLVLGLAVLVRRRR